MSDQIHAKLGASGACRWLNCPASMRMEEDLPDTSSEFAEQGTAAHELAERCLKEGVGADFYAGHTFNGFEADLEMVQAVQLYLDYVRNQKGEMLVEQKVDFSPWVPEGFGTCDCLIIEGNTARVIDFKFGKGFRVDAEYNPQVMLYALGALHEYEFIFDDIDLFNLSIVQPRLDHISEFQIPKKELLAWAEKTRVKAEQCLEEDAPFNPGEKQCRFCKAKSSCRALAEHALKTVVEGFESVVVPITVKDISRLSNEEVAMLLPQLDIVSNWITALQVHALGELERGHEVPGYKLVAGRSIRKWRNEEAAEKALLASRLKVADIYSTKLISPTRAEKALGKNHPLLKEQVVKPEGRPSIAKQSDRRPAIGASFENAFKHVA